MKGVIHLLMVQWNLGNVCFLTLLSGEKSRNACGKMTVWINILSHFSTCPTNPLVSQRSGCPWLWEVRVHSEILTCFSAFRGYGLTGFGGRSFQNSPRPKTQHFEVTSVLQGACGQCWAGVGSGGGGAGSGWEEIRANSSEMIWQEMTQYRPHTTRWPALGEGASRHEGEVLPNHRAVPERSRWGWWNNKAFPVCVFH